MEGEQLYLHALIANQELKESPQPILIKKSDKHLAYEQEQIDKAKAAKEAKLLALRQAEAAKLQK